MAVVLPAFRAAEETFVEGLTGALMHSLAIAGEEPRRNGTLSPGSDPVRWLAECLVFGDELPVTVSELLDHPDAASRTCVVDGTALEPADRKRLAGVLTRIALESRPRGAARRPRIVAIGTRDLLPQPGDGKAGAVSDVTFETAWWWGRLTRWDVASRIAQVLDAGDAHGVLTEVRLETLVEVCRWDIDLADCLAHAWDGNPSSISTVIKENAAPPATPRDRHERRARLTPQHRPDPAMEELWDAGRMEWWHHELSPSVCDMLAEPGAVEKAVWVAQARVLLPWIETQRRLLLGLLLKRFGRAAVDRAALRATGGSDSSLTEVGTLFGIARELTLSAHPIRDAAYVLRHARNKLAHMDSLSVTEQQRLLEACAGALH